MNQKSSLVAFGVLLSIAVSSSYADQPRLAMARYPTESAAPANEVVIRQCKVTSVHDGDSMRVRCPGFKKTIPIRLDQIDAPELDQAYGVASRDYLRSLCRVGSQAVVHDLGRDTYNRHLGRVYCGSVDVSAAMVKTGSAWVYDYYATDQQLYLYQDSARSEKRGLWAGPKKPTAPWTFRRQQRQR